MTESITLKFKHNPREYASAIRIYFARTLHTKYDVIIALIALIAGVVYTSFFGYTIITYLLLGTSAFYLAMIFMTYVVTPARWVRQRMDLMREITIAFSEEGIRYRAENIDSKLQWSLYKNVIETDRFYFLVYGKSQFSLIPKRVFASAEEERSFRELLSRKNLLRVTP